MLDKSNIKGYAIALFELVKEANKFEQIHVECNQILTVVQQNPNLIDFWSALNVPNQEKLKLVDDLLFDYDPILKNLIKVAIERKSINKIKTILTHYLKLSNEALKISFVKVITAKEISQDHLDRIKDKLEKHYHRRFEIKNVIDKSLISGFQIVSESRIIQKNYKNDLAQLIGAITTKNIKGGR